MIPAVGQETSQAARIPNSRYRLLGGVAAVAVPEDVARYAYRQGLYVLAQSGDAVEIRNDGRFAAREW